MMSGLVDGGHKRVRECDARDDTEVPAEKRSRLAHVLNDDTIFLLVRGMHLYATHTRNKRIDKCLDDPLSDELHDALLLPQQVSARLARLSRAWRRISNAYAGTVIKQEQLSGPGYVYQVWPYDTNSAYFRAVPAPGYASEELSMIDVFTLARTLARVSGYTSRITTPEKTLARILRACHFHDEQAATTTASGEDQKRQDALRTGAHANVVLDFLASAYEAATTTLRPDDAARQQRQRMSYHLRHFLLFAAESGLCARLWFTAVRMGSGTEDKNTIDRLVDMLDAMTRARQTIDYNVLLDELPERRTLAEDIYDTRDERFNQPITDSDRHMANNLLARSESYSFALSWRCDRFRAQWRGQKESCGVTPRHYVAFNMAWQLARYCYAYDAARTLLERADCSRTVIEWLLVNVLPEGETMIARNPYVFVWLTDLLHAMAPDEDRFSSIVTGVESFWGKLSYDTLHRHNDSVDRHERILQEYNTNCVYLTMVHLVERGLPYCPAVATVFVPTVCPVRRMKKPSQRYHFRVACQRYGHVKAFQEAVQQSWGLDHHRILQLFNASDVDDYIALLRMGIPSTDLPMHEIILSAPVEKQVALAAAAGVSVIHDLLSNLVFHAKTRSTLGLSLCDFAACIRGLACIGGMVNLRQALTVAQFNAERHVGVWWCLMFAFNSRVHPIEAMLEQSPDEFVSCIVRAPETQASRAWLGPMSPRERLSVVMFIAHHPYNSPDKFTVPASQKEAAAALAAPGHRAYTMADVLECRVPYQRAFSRRAFADLLLALSE